MIFYFSGTGSSAWAARQLARLTGGEAVTDAMLAGARELIAGADAYKQGL